MGDQSNVQVGRLSAHSRAVVIRIGQIACALPDGDGNLADGLVAGFESLLGAVPVGGRRLLLAGLAAFDHGARLYPPARGRRFVRLTDAQAEAYFRAVLSSRHGLGVALQRVKGLIVFCYYELPEVQHQIGYRPGPYIAAVSRRRLDDYGDDIRAGERAVFADPAQDAP